MNRTLPKAIALALSASIFFSAPVARAGSVAGFGGSTEITQLANNIELAQSYLQQVQAYATQLQQWNTQLLQYQNMLVNTARLPTQIWGNVQQSLQAVRNLAAAGQALAYTASNFGAQFQAKYKGYQYRPGVTWADEYQKWSTIMRDTMKNTLTAAGYQANDFATEEGLLLQLRAASQSSEGQLKAIQVGSQIAEQQVQQLQKLRQLMLLQLQSQNTYLATQQDKADMVEFQRASAFRYQNPNGPYTTFRGGSR